MQTRSLSSTPHTQRQKPSYLTVPADEVPDYPYGRFQTYKQRNAGLYAGRKIRFGNTVSEDHGRRSRTTWLPNRHTKRLWSQALGAFIRTRLTTQALKTIDKLGGIDAYLLGSKQARIKELGPAGWALRWKIIQTPLIQERFAREREALGLPPKPPKPQSQPAQTQKSEDQALDAELVDLAAEAGQPANANAPKMTAAAVHDMIDDMITKDEEFVLGPPEEKPSEARGRANLERFRSHAQQVVDEVSRELDELEKEAGAGAAAGADADAQAAETETHAKEKA